MSNYITTNIRLFEDDYLRLKDEATRKRTSLSAVIREKVGQKKVEPKDFKKILLSIDTSWFTEKDYEQYQKNREQVEKQIKKRGWAGK